MNESLVPSFVSCSDPESLYRGKSFVALDFETDSEQKGSALVDDNDIVLSCWYVVDEQGNKIKRHVWGGIYDVGQLLDDIANTDFLLSFNCFSGDTKFITHEGIKSFKETVGQTVKIWNERGWQSATVKSYGISPTKKITMVPYNRSRTSIAREVVATPNHRWKVDRLYATNRRGRFREEAPGYITTDELKVGDKIWATMPEVSIEENSDGFRHGLVFADGNRIKGRNAFRIRLCGWKEKYKYLFSRYTYPPSCEGDPVVSYYKSDTNLKAVPEESCSAEYKASFIEAWQRLDGTDSGNGTSRTVDTTDREAALWLKDNAAYAGYYVSGYSEHTHKSGYSNECITMYKVVLTKNSDMGWTVRSVVDDETQQVYCVEVDGLDRFTLDHGIYTGNCKFELQWLKRAGAELRDILVYDPMLAQWVLDGNMKGKGYERSLKALAKKYGGRPKTDLVGKLMNLGVPTRAINRRWLLSYCWRDVDAMLDIFYEQAKEVSRRGVWHLVHTRFLTCNVLADIEFEGLQLDAAKVEQEYSRVGKLLEELGGKLAEMTGGINLGSPKQLGVYLYDKLGFVEVKDHRGKPIRTGKGERSTNSKVMAQLTAETEEQKAFLKLYKDYNKAASLLEKNLEYFLLTCKHYGGLFRGIFKQNSVQTHRLASSGIPTIFPGKKTAKSVQLQNIPREYKELFYSGDDDYIILSFDSSQVEFRVAVDMGRDSVGYHEIVNGTDIHSFTANVLTEAGEPTTRQEAKAATFRPLNIAA